MKNSRNPKIYTDKHGRKFIKQGYFIGGKLKFNRVYVIEGMPVDLFYEVHAANLDHFIHENYHLITEED